MNWKGEIKNFNGDTISLFIDSNYDQKDKLLTEFSKCTLKDRYLSEGESFQDAFARVASYYANDDNHAARLYHYISNLWLIPATPVLSNGGTLRGLPISCFLNEAQDSLEGIIDLWNENVWLASRGGGIGSYWGNLRSIGEKVKRVGTTSGIMPFIKVMDSMTLAISQGSLRRGSSAVYLPISHPEIEEFIEMRKPTGGDPNRKSLNLHHGILITNDFMRCVEEGTDWALRSPKDDKVVGLVPARQLWARVLTTRIETGEPYIIFIDHVNDTVPEHHKKSGLMVKTSNLCSEITLPTGLDHHGKERTAVCCLSSVNIEHFDQWSKEKDFIYDCLAFLDNVLSDFINRAPDTMAKARYSASMERSVGLGAMGLHYYFNKCGVPFASAVAKSLNKKVFKYIRSEVDKSNERLAEERGACPDAQEHGIMRRFSYATAIAPNASTGIIAGTSPSVEPLAANAFTQKTKSGSFLVKNPYLDKLLDKYSKNTEQVWSSIIANQGSVHHLDFLTDYEKQIFQTAYEIPAQAIIELAGDRSDCIDQAQSINVFLHADIHKGDLHKVHMLAWKHKVKSLYYCRSMSLQRGASVNDVMFESDCISCEG